MKITQKLKNSILISVICICIILGYINLPYLLCSKYSFKVNKFTIYSNFTVKKPKDTLFGNSENLNILEKDNYSYNIFLTNNYNQFTVLSPHYKAFGITGIISGNIIIAPCDISKNQVKRNAKRNNVRSLSSVILHECTHRYLNKKYGVFKMLFVKTWKEEGFCEYIAEESSFGFSKGLDLFISKKEDKSNSYDYFKYRLYVKYLIDYKKMTFDEILDKSFDINELEKEIRNNIINGLYKPLTK